MRQLHRPDLWSWSAFDTDRDIDFNSFAWIRADGNVLVDPIPLIPHDREQLEQLGGAALIVITTSDHVRAGEELAQAFDARLLGPAAERDSFPITCHDWSSEGDEVAPGLFVLEMDGSKTPGELALLLDGSTLITGDLIRGPHAGRLDLLAAEKLKDPDAALASVSRLAEIEGIEVVLPGDGWCVFHDGQRHLRELVSRS